MEILSTDAVCELARQMTRSDELLVTEPVAVATGCYIQHCNSLRFNPRLRG